MSQNSQSWVSKCCMSLDFWYNSSRAPLVNCLSASRERIRRIQQSDDHWPSLTTISSRKTCCWGTKQNEKRWKHDFWNTEQTYWYTLVRMKMKESEQRDASFLGVLGVLFFQATSGPNLVLTVPAYGFDHRLLRRLWTLSLLLALASESWYPPTPA